MITPIRAYSAKGSVRLSRTITHLPDGSLLICDQAEGSTLPETHRLLTTVGIQSKLAQIEGIITLTIPAKYFQGGVTSA